MRIVMVGPRCSGKTTVSNLVATKLGYDCLHLDNMIEQRVGNVTAEIVKRFGWEGFRAAEKKVIAETAGTDRCVVDAGGGAIEDADSRLKLTRGSIVVYLTAKIDELMRRFDEGRDRPPLTDSGNPREEMMKITASRDPIYRAIASIVIDTTGKNPNQVAEEILNCLEM